MSRPDARIPLGVQTPDIASPLIELQAAARKDKLLQQEVGIKQQQVNTQKSVADSNIANDAQQRTLTGQQIDTNAQTIKQNKAKLIAMDTIAASELLKGGQTKEAGALLVNNIQRMKEIGADTSNAERIAMLAATDPVGASQYLEQHVLPAIHATMPEIFAGTPVKKDEVTDMGQQISKDRTGKITAQDIPGFKINPKDTEATGGGGEKKGLNPIVLQDGAGNYYPGQLSSEGGLSLPGLPAGMKFIPDGGRLGYDPNAIKTQGGAKTEVKVNDINATAAPEAAAAGQKVTATDTAKLAVDRAAKAPEARAKVDAVKAQSQVLIDNIDQILNHPGLQTAVGTSGTFDPRNWPTGVSSDAKDVQALIDTLKNKTVIDSMQTLRATGATFGQQSDKEGSRLENSRASLEKIQSLPQFVKGLKQMRQQALESMGRFEGAYDSEYAPYAPSQQGQQPATTPAGQIGRFKVEVH